MKLKELHDHLIAVSENTSSENVQVNFMFSDIVLLEKNSSAGISKIMSFGVYHSYRTGSSQFYRPYSKLFDLGKIEERGDEL